MSFLHRTGCYWQMDDFIILNYQNLILFIWIVSTTILIKYNFIIFINLIVIIISNSACRFDPFLPTLLTSCQTTPRCHTQPFCAIQLCITPPLTDTFHVTLGYIYTDDRLHWYRRWDDGILRYDINEVTWNDDLRN